MKTLIHTGTTTGGRSEVFNVSTHAAFNRFRVLGLKEQIEFDEPGFIA